VEGGISKVLKGSFQQDLKSQVKRPSKSMDKSKKKEKKEKKKKKKIKIYVIQALKSVKGTPQLCRRVITFHHPRRKVRHS